MKIIFWKKFTLAILLVLLAAPLAASELHNLTPSYIENGMAHSIQNIRRRRSPNQDRFVVASFHKDSHHVQIYAVFDGHSTDKVSQYLLDHFVPYIEASFPSLSSGDVLTDQERQNIEEHLEKIALTIDRQICVDKVIPMPVREQRHEKNPGRLRHADSIDEKLDLGGSTAVAILRIDKRHLFLFNLGDSQAKVYLVDDKNNAQLLAETQPHKPTTENEEARIVAAGGSVVRGRLLSILDVSRGFGDCDVKFSAPPIGEEQIGDDIFEYTPNGMVSAVPTIDYIDLYKFKELSRSHSQQSSQDQHSSVRLLVGSDGIFDDRILKPELVHEWIKEKKQRQQGRKLNWASYACTVARQFRSSDDITLIVDEYELF